MSNVNNIPLARLRRLEILALLEEAGSVRVNQLAERFSVAEETIRRDLDKLSESGQLARTHGGALSVRSDRSDLPLTVRKGKHSTEKHHIAKLALPHIQPNDVVAFDASTTALELVCLLPDIPLTVITTAVDVVRLLADRKNIQVICSGGTLDQKSLSFLGPIAENTLEQFSINKAFLSAKGIDLERGFSEASPTHASIKRRLMELADCSYILADHSKFGVRSMAYFANLQAVDVLITDNGIESSVLDALSEAGLKVEVASSKIHLEMEV